MGRIGTAGPAVVVRSRAVRFTSTGDGSGWASGRAAVGSQNGSTGCGAREQEALQRGGTHDAAVEVWLRWAMMVERLAVPNAAAMVGMWGRWRGGGR